MEWKIVRPFLNVAWWAAKYNKCLYLKNWHTQSIGIINNYYSIGVWFLHSVSLILFDAVSFISKIWIIKLIKSLLLGNTLCGPFNTFIFEVGNLF